MLWAVTAYFNPLRYRRRLAAYREFRRRIGVPLLTIELGFDGAFELGEGDADLLLRVSDGDVMWQKERLINVAVSRLPAQCTTVASMDCDVFFPDQRWHVEALAQSERLPMVQAFSTVHHLRREWTSGEDYAAAIELSQPGVGGLANPAQGVLGVLDRTGGGASPGFGWIYQRELLERHGLYDGCIVGGGDTATVSAAIGSPEAVVQLHAMNAHQQRRYRRWAEGFHAAVRGRIGALDGAVCHIWHGALPHRQARQRHLDFGRFEFDPAADIALSAQGAWRWSSHKPDLHAYVRGYFAARQEDG